MESGAIARFGEITAYGDRFRGEGFHLVDLVNWVEAPDVRGESVDRPAAHGRFVLPQFLTERTVKMSGFHVTDSHTKQMSAATRLKGLILSSIKLTIEDPLLTAFTRGVVKVARYVPSGFAPEGQWALELECDDPLIYGKTTSYPAGSNATHRGNFPAVPIHNVTGTTAAYTITGPAGMAFAVSSGPGSGTDVIDMTDGLVYRNGALLVGAVTRADLWSVPSGAGGVTHTISAGKLATDLTDTYV